MALNGVRLGYVLGILFVWITSQTFHKGRRNNNAEIFGYMAIDRDTWLLRTNVLRDLNSCLTAGRLIISSI